MKLNIETWAGLFLLLGIAVVCTLILMFSDLGDMFKPTYKITLTFADASGLIKGSDVFLSGAPIGKVITDPQPVPDQQAVRIVLRIDQRAKLREDANFVIGSSGLLGDRFVDVEPHEQSQDEKDAGKPLAPYVHDGEELNGAEPNDLSTLTHKAQPIVEQVNQIVAKLNNQILTQQTTDDLKDTIAQLKELAKNGNDLINQARDSRSPVGRLLTDKKMGDDLAAFVTNLREHGVLFYSDTAPKDKPSDQKTPNRKSDNR